jgi:hypothetical protein
MKIQNRFTGELKNLPWMSPEERTLWLMKKSIRAFDKIIVRGKMSISFLTVTQSNKSVAEGYKWITSLMSSMQKEYHRRGQKMVYVAVQEIQPKRYQRYGVLASHWHIAIGSSVPGGLPHGKRLENGHIQKLRNGRVITWNWLYKNAGQKFGMYFCCDCWSKNVYDYLTKYLAKGVLMRDFKTKVGRKIRSFSSSKLDLEDYMSWCQKIELKNLLDREPDCSDLYMRRAGSKINLCARSVVEAYWLDGYSRVKVTYPVIFTIRGEWFAVGDNISPCTATQGALTA